MKFCTEACISDLKCVNAMFQWFLPTPKNNKSNSYDTKCSLAYNHDMLFHHGGCAGIKIDFTQTIVYRNLKLKVKKSECLLLL